MFFNASDMESPRVSMEHYREWAGEIASSYLNANCLPSDTLSKIAQSEELEPFQIEILAAEANKTIHTMKYASAEDKYFAADFPLADAKKVICSLQTGTVKTAGVFTEPKLGLSEGPDAYEMFGVKPEVMDKTASVKHQLKNASGKAELLKSKIDDEIIYKTAAIEQATKEFVKTAKAMVLESDDRMKTLGHLYHFTKCAGFEKTGKKLLAKTAHVLRYEGKLEPTKARIAFDFFSKEADLKAPEDLISENLNATVVNGNHPLYITLKTIEDNEAELARWNRESNIVDDKVRILKQKIRAL